ncbi:hypothetical protein [Alcaligenes sp. Marseille-Q7550]
MENHHGYSTSSSDGGRGLQRQDLSPGPLGVVGNLRFTPQEGGTAGLGRRDVIKENVRRTLANVKSRCSFASSEARRQHNASMQVFKNSRRVGNLLGRLTAPPGNVKARTHTAKALEQLSMPARDDLANLRGGRESLFIYMNDLTRADLIALRDGALGDPGARDAVLGQVPVQAAGVLGQVAQALDLPLARTIVEEPLSQIRRLMLPAPHVNGPALATSLIILFMDLAPPRFNQWEDGPATIALLDAYFRSLPEYRLSDLAYVFKPSRMACAQEALQGIDYVQKRQALAMLDSIRQSLGREIHRRARPTLDGLEAALSQAVAEDDRLAGSKALYGLHVLVHRMQSPEWLPDETSNKVRQLVNDSLPLFQDSGGALDKAVVRYLSKAKKSLIHFGLDVEAVPSASRSLFWWT